MPRATVIQNSHFSFLVSRRRRPQQDPTNNQNRIITIILHRPTYSRWRFELLFSSSVLCLLQSSDSLCIFRKTRRRRWRRRTTDFYSLCFFCVFLFLFVDTFSLSPFDRSFFFLMTCVVVLLQLLRPISSFIVPFRENAEIYWKIVSLCSRDHAHTLEMLMSFMCLLHRRRRIEKSNWIFVNFCLGLHCRSNTFWPN